ncbi:hypothetical protein U1Q18_037827 [Sarracenia purpurea var. burkii]
MKEVSRAFRRADSWIYGGARMLYYDLWDSCKWFLSGHFRISLMETSALPSTVWGTEICIAALRLPTAGLKRWKRNIEKALRRISVV